MNALYTLLSNTFSIPKATLIGFAVSGIFSVPFLSAQVSEPGTVPVLQEQGTEVPKIADPEAARIRLSQSGSPTPIYPGGANPAAPFADEWSSFINDKMKDNSVAETYCDCPGNKITNPSFENGTNGWTWWNGSLVTGTYAAKCGTNSGQFQHSGNGNNGGYYQNLTGIAVGETVSLTVWAGQHEPQNYHAYVGFEFYKSDWTYISNDLAEVNAGLPGMGQYSVDAVVPANTHYVRVIGYCNGNWLKSDGWCVTVPENCNASITGLNFNKIDGGADISITNGGTYNQSTLNSDYNLEAVVTAGSESAQFTVTGPTGGSNTENTEPYNYPGGTAPWSPAPGSYTVTVKIYSQDNLGGTLCDEFTIAFTIQGCDNVTSGGTIGSDQVACGVSSYDPAPFTNIASPTGGSGNLEYMWLKAPGPTCPAIGDPSWSQISGANLATYDAPAITSSTCYLRCSRRAGCNDWDGESNRISVVFNPAITLTETHKNVLCNGNSTGDINLSVSGGTSPYTYNWGGGVTTQDRTNLAAGTYTVTVTDAKSCTATKSITITQPAALNPTTTKVNVSCNGGANGSIDLTVTGGTGAYTYSWTGGATTQDRSGLAAGTYTVTVTDANACTKTVATTITQPSALTLTETNVDVICKGSSTGSIDLTVSGGTSPYTYSWTGGATTQDRSGLAAGTYTVTVTDANACTKTLSATITEPSLALSLTETHVDATCGNANGSVDLTVTGGTGAYTYSWTGGATTQDRSGLAAGTYTVTVTDANACTKTISATLTSSGGPSLTETHKDVLCKGGSTGSIDISVSGGTSPFTYSWNGGQTTQDRSNLAVGTYTVTVTDANSCTATKSVNITEPTALSLTETHVDATCGNSNGSIDLSVTGGTGAYTYAWAGGATTQDRSNLGAGTYTVTVTDVNACTKTLSVTLTNTGGPSLTETNVDVLCKGGSTGSIDLTVSGGTAPFTYSWNGGQTTQDRSGLAAGTYTVTVTDANSCTATKSVAITEPAAALSLTETHVDATCGNSNGSIDLSVTGGTGAYTYSWTGGATTQDRSGLGAGTYTVTVTDANACTKTLSVSITNIGGPTLSETHKDVLCNGASTGSIDLTVTGGTAPYTYSWTGGATTQDRSNLAAGTYTVTVTDANVCTKTISAAITQPSTLTLTETHVDVLCNGNSTGSIDLTVTGGTGAYTYSWTGGATTQDRSNLAAGTYTVTVTDANACTKTISAAITQPSALTLTETNVDVLCNGNSTGSIDLTVTGGTGAYTYSWTGGATTQDRSNLAAGTYTVTVTDANACTKTISAAITQPSALTLTETHVNATCGIANGSIDLTVTGGTGTYTYSWTGGATTQDISGRAAGTYTVTVTDANACTKTLSVVLSNTNGPTLSTTQVNVLCFGASTGSIDLTVSGGTSPFTYAWTGGATTQDRSGLAAGTYTVTVTDANGCTATKATTITQLSQLVVDLGPNVSVCASENYTITSSVTGGTPAYTYSWSNGSTTANITVATGSSSATYTVTVTDVNNCTATDAVTLTPDKNYTNGGTIAASQSNCGAFDPAAFTSVSDPSGGSGSGGPEYIWLFSTVTCTPPTIGDPNWTVIPGANASTYDPGLITQTTCFIRCSRRPGCTNYLGESNVLQITINPSPILSTTQVNVLCNGASTGSIDLTVTGGTSPYTYSWTGGATTQDRSGLAAGTYTVTVTDANGCTKTISATITQPSALTLTETNVDVLCNGASTGSIDLTVTGGTSPYTYSWTGGATTQDRSNLAAGTYTVTVTDANACTKTISAAITQPSALTLTETNVDVLCKGNSTGSIDLTVTGGTGAYTYSWTGGATTQDRSNLAAGTYTVTVTDANACTKTLSATITEPSAALSLTETHVDATCGNSNGSIDLTVTGGTGGYTYNWGGGVTTQDRSNLAAGTYTVTVTDANACTKTLSATIANIGGPSVSETHVNVLCFGNSTGSIDISVSGGTAPFTYSWNGGQTTQDRSGLAAGTYTVTVTDANGCTAIKSATITEPAALSLTETHVNVLCNGNSTGSIDLTVTGGTGAYTYSWTGGATTQDRSGLAAGTYTVTVTDANACTKTLSVTITQPSALNLTETHKGATCYGGANGAIDLTVTGGTGAHLFLDGRRNDARPLRPGGGHLYGDGYRRQRLHQDPFSNDHGANSNHPDGDACERHLRQLERFYRPYGDGRHGRIYLFVDRRRDDARPLRSGSRHLHGDGYGRQRLHQNVVCNTVEHRRSELERDARERVLQGWLERLD